MKAWASPEFGSEHSGDGFKQVLNLKPGKILGPKPRSTLRGIDITWIPSLVCKKTGYCTPPF